MTFGTIPASIVSWRSLLCLWRLTASAPFSAHWHSLGRNVELATSRAMVLAQDRIPLQARQHHLWNSARGNHGKRRGRKIDLSYGMKYAGSFVPSCLGLPKCDELHSPNPFSRRLALCSARAADRLLYRPPRLGFESSTRRRSSANNRYRRSVPSRIWSGRARLSF